MADVPSSGMRTREIEELTNLYVIHPLSRLFVRVFTRLRIKPNSVSITGMVMGAAAAVAYYQYQNPWFCAAGFLFMIGWHVMDGADGQLARSTGQTSEIGKVLDGLCDHVTFTLVYLSLSIAMTPVYGPRVWIVTVLAGVSHLIQATAYEFQRQSYDYWVHGKKSARIIPLDEFRQVIEQKTGLARLFARLNLVYMKVQYQVAAFDESLNPVLDAAVSEAGEQNMRIRQAYRSINVKSVRTWALLSSNYRTLAIFVACIAGYPVLYFLFEIVLLNLALWVLTRSQRSNLSRFRQWVDENIISVETVES